MPTPTPTRWRVLLDQVVEQGIAAFHDLTCERGLFTPRRAARPFARSREVGDPDEGPRRRLGHPRRAGEPRSPAVRCRPSTSPTRPTRRSTSVGATDTVAVLLPQAELVYMTERRANARLLIEQRVPVAIATDYCSSIEPTSLVDDVGNRRTVVQADVRGGPRRRDLERRLLAAVATDRGSIDAASAGISPCCRRHPDELCLAVGRRT